LALCALLVTGCAGTITFEPAEDDPGQPRAATQEAGAGDHASRTVRVPEDRTGNGIEVRAADGRTFPIPPGHDPPPGTCRIWRPELPPGRQAPPGDCDELEQRLPPGAYLVYG
jgi:hypothetical protein